MGGSGSGGSSGKVDFPAHMKTAHTAWLDHTGTDAVSYSMVDLLNAAWANPSPLASAVAYNPASRIATYEAAGTALSTLVNALDITEMKARVSDDGVERSVEAFTALVDADLEATVYPRFEAGMRDINAVASSAFAIGRANIEASRSREIAKYHADVRTAARGDALRLIELKFQYMQVVARTITEQQRVAYVMLKEQLEQDVEYDVKDALWDVELYQYGANLLGAIGGGSLVPKAGGLSKAQSAVGGAMGGAAVGTMVSPGWGTAIGAVVGGVAGLLA